MDREEVRSWVGQEGSSLDGHDEQRRATVGRRKNVIRVNGLAVAHMLAAMMEGAYTAKELSEISGLAIATVRIYIKAFQKTKVVHIADWTEDGRGNRTARAFMLGNKPDAKKPQAQDNKVVCARYRAKMKQLKMLKQLTGQDK